MDFRHSARESLARAKAELANGDPERLKYAALELRFAMEAVTYDRALAFKKEIPPEEYRNWQPRKLMQVLVDIDPKIAMTSTIAVGLQDDPGTPAPPERMRTLGTDFVFTLGDLKAHYDAIGSHLHLPSLDQIDKRNVSDAEKIRERCQTVAGLLERVLSSRVWNSTIGNFSELKECMRCGKPVRKRIPLGADEVEAQCFECGAEYTVKDSGPNQSTWHSKTQKIPCPTEGCEKHMVLWSDEIKAGKYWTCRGCGQKYGIDLAVVKVEDETK